MSAIAYITDSKMLELHRLNNHKTMNFWRPSAGVSFSDFGIGDLVFFLSKDKEHKKKNEKGIVGFGRLAGIDVSSIKKMWENYGIYNGYNTFEEFREAILRVSKDRKIPRKISSFRLENVTFFQPIYLSECGMNVSSNVESYIYIKPEETVFRILSLADRTEDIWSSLSGLKEAIDEEKRYYALYLAHKHAGELVKDEKSVRRAQRNAKKYLEEHPGYRQIHGSDCDLFRMESNDIEIVIYKDKYLSEKEIVGQAALYRYYLENYLGYGIDLRFRTIDDDEKMKMLLNSI